MSTGDVDMSRKNLDGSGAERGISNAFRISCGGYVSCLHTVKAGWF